MKFLLALTLLLVVGCQRKRPEPPVLNPPIFARGDVVKLHDSDILGIITNVSQSESEPHHWMCYVMFADISLEYDEKLLVLHKYPEWHVQPNHTPEVDSKDFQTP